MLAKSITQYLSQYGEPEARSLGASFKTFGHVLVIPALDENELLLGSLDRLPRGDVGPVLVILVVNALEGDVPVQQRSDDLLAAIHARYPALATPGATVEFRHHPQGSLLVVDRATKGRGLPGKGGVGLARKIGCDIALRFRASGSIESPWIHVTDADATLPADYFARVRNLPESASAAIYPFWHQCEAELESAWAIEHYELFLRYYELGLRYSGSPYAFQTLGSAIAIRALSYAQVRGFPKRTAAEDFYLLNKAAKVGSIVRLGGDPILLLGRSSHRVPFGTGRAVIELRGLRQQGIEYLVYAPAAFDYLKAWLSFLNDLSFDGDCLAAYDRMDSKLLAGVLNALGAREALEQAWSQATSREAFRRRLRIWFDAFKTLKFIHRVTDVIGKVPLLEAIGSATFLPNFPSHNLGWLRAELARLSGADVEASPNRRPSFVPEGGRLEP